MTNDDIPINVSHASFYDTYYLIIEAILDTGGVCVFIQYILNSGQNDFIIPAGTLVDNTGCLGDVVESKVYIETEGVVVADPAFDSVFLYDLYSDNGVVINLSP